MDYEKLNVVVGSDKRTVVCGVSERVPSGKFLGNYKQRRARPLYLGPNSLDVDVKRHTTSAKVPWRFSIEFNCSVVPFTVYVCCVY